MTKLVEIFNWLIESFQVFVIIKVYERGLVLRWGEVNRELLPGLHFLWPLAEEIMVENIVRVSEEVGSQALTTKDGVSVLLDSVVSYSICDMVKYCTLVEDADNIIIDCVYGIIKEYVSNANWKKVCTHRFQQEIHAEIHTKAMQWGINMEAFAFSNLTKGRVLRLLQKEYE